MRLYKMEFYKLFHRKSFFLWSVAAVLITMLYFWIQVEGEVCTVGDTTYKGFEAVQKNRQITEEYKGVLTDEKVQDIVKTYGLPKKVEKNYPGFRDANYVNAFVTDYVSDGFLYSWDDYKIPTHVYPLSDTVIGEFQETFNRKVMFYYARGWDTFIEVLQCGMILASILVLSCISVLFAEEGQTKMKSLIFTTKEGGRGDGLAKIAAAFTLTILIYSCIVVLDFLMCVTVFGIDGFNCPIGITMDCFYMDVKQPHTCMRTSSFIGITLIISLIAMLTLCAMTLCVSAHFNSCFHAVMVSLACWGMPVMVRMFFGGFAYLFMAGTPVFLILSNNIMEILRFQLIGRISITFAVVLLTVGVVCGYYKYRNSPYFY